MRNRLRILAVLSTAGLLQGCQVLCVYDCYSSPVPQSALTSVTVIPSAADGHIGAVVVDPQGSRNVLDTAYGSARIGAARGVESYTSSAQEVQDKYGRLLESRPRPPASLTAYFLSGTDKISPWSLSIIDELRQEIAARNNSEVTVIGHTDSVGDAAGNDILAEQRASRMRDQLIAMGIPAELITVAARGERELLVQTADGVAEERNRRVEISIR